MMSQPMSVTSSPNDTCGLAAMFLSFAFPGWLHTRMVPSSRTRNHTGTGSGRTAGLTTPHGLKDASRDPLILRDWWELWADANVAVVTGAMSGVIVLDVDGEPGATTLSTMPALPGSWHSRAGRGEHYWFRHP